MDFYIFDGSAEFLHTGTKHILGKVIELLRNDRTIYNEEAKLAIHILTKLSIFILFGVKNVQNKMHAIRV